MSRQGVLIRGGYNLSRRLGVVPKAKTLVSKFAGPQETIKRKLSLCYLTFVWMTNPLCFYGGGGGRGDRFRSKQDRKIKNNSINILPIVIDEKEQHSRLNTQPYVRYVREI